jgi:hypothetical protein
MAISMYTPKHIVPKEVAEAMAEIFDDPETGLSEQALRQLMKEAFLLDEMERKRQMGEAMLREGGAARHPPAGLSPD